MLRWAAQLRGRPHLFVVPGKRVQHAGKLLSGRSQHRVHKGTYRCGLQCCGPAQSQNACAELAKAWTAGSGRAPLLLTSALSPDTSLPRSSVHRLRTRYACPAIAAATPQLLEHS
jgi:hypothetical protein